jgi:enoyl-CoA hydratase
VSGHETYVRLERQGRVAHLVLCRPEKLNAWGWESARQLADRCDELRFDSGVRAVLLRAEGRSFCAGVDMGMPEDRITGRSPAEKVRNYYERFRWVHERFNVLINLPQPVVAAVQGHCLGAGLEVAMMCDIRIASEDATFDMRESRVGVSVDAGGDMRLVNAVGPGKAKLLALTGRRIDAATALEWGIVEEVVPGGELLERAGSTCEEIAANAPLAVQGIKRTINFWAERGMSEASRFQAASASPCFVSEDMAAGYRTLETREPAEFEGK